MKEGYRLLGDFIRQVDVRNTDGKEENLLGVSVQKMFIPSIANTVGTDFTKYKVVKRGQFTYIPDTSRRGDKIGIALLTDYDEGLVSNIYTVFEVKDENELLPEYLMLWFSRPEFDRYARFKSHGNVREIMDWDEMCKVELSVPSIDKQRSIVKAYQTITERIELKRRINDNLAKTIKAVFKSWFLDFEELKKEKDSFKGMGIDYEEKAFYDILKAVAKKYEFEYPDDKMIELSKRIKLIVDDKAKYTDWSTRDDIKANLQVDLILLLDEFDYPPVTIDDVYKEVLEQAENFKKYSE